MYIDFKVILLRLDYDEYGCLLPGIYELSLKEFEEEFVKDKSQRRQDIFDNYKYHITKIKDTDCCLNHWIDGSFVTLEEKPNDIDTLTEFDGVKSKELGIVDEIKHMIYDAPLITSNFCHSFCVFKVPEEYGEDYDEFLEFKSKVLFLLFSMNNKTKKLKGFIKLKGEN